MLSFVDDGIPVVDPGFDEVKIVAADETQQLMAAGQGTVERRMRLATLNFDFGSAAGGVENKARLPKRLRSIWSRLKSSSR